MLWLGLGGRYWGCNQGLTRWDEGSLGKAGCRAYWGDSVRSRGGYPSGGGSDVDVTVTIRVRESIASMMAHDVNGGGSFTWRGGTREILDLLLHETYKEVSLLNRQL